MSVLKYNVQVKAFLATSNIIKTIQLDIDEEIVKMCYGNKEKLTRALGVFIRPYFASFDSLKEVKVISCIKA